MVVVYSTFPSKEEAITVGRKLLEERLIACFNAFRITSGYRWEGKIVEDEEWGVFFKTKDELKGEVMKRIGELHPYSVPAIFTFPVGEVHPPYSEWLDGETR